MKNSLRRYLNFVWDCSEKFGEIEETVMDKLSPTLRSKLCVHIFGAVLYKCPFLHWMRSDQEAMKKLCLRVNSTFLEANDVLFSYGELNSTIFILVHGWVTLCMGATFSDEDELKGKGEVRGAVARRADDFQQDQQMRAATRRTSEIEGLVAKTFFRDPDVMSHMSHRTDSTPDQKHSCAGLKIRSKSNSLLHTSTFGPFSAVSTPIFASK